MQLEEILKRVKKVRKSLLSKPNVVSVGVGYKEINGIKTDQLSIICSVEKKMPIKTLSSKDRIPKKSMGVVTDVVQSGEIKALGNTKRERPASGGDSIGHFSITAGTFGCTVHKKGQIMILSNNHVIANSNKAKEGDSILQPGPHDGGNQSDQIAVLRDWVRIRFEGENDNVPPEQTECPIANGSANILNLFASIFKRKSRVMAYVPQNDTYNKVDAAIAEPLSDHDISEVIRNLGEVSGVKNVEIGMKVQKQGRTTGHTTGIVSQIGVTTKVNYGPDMNAYFEDQIIITSDNSNPFSQPGDSGSAILNELNIVGLLFAGSDKVTIANRIENVFSIFNCTL